MQSWRMQESQKLQLRASEIRTRLAEIGGLADDAVTDEIQTETIKLTTEYRTVETKLQAAIVAEDEEAKQAELRGGDGEPDAEIRALRGLQDRVSFGAYLRAFADGAQLAGAERELTEHRGLSIAGNVVPYDALLPPAERRAELRAMAELRADAVTPAADSGNPTNQSTILQRVFARAAVRRLGVAMPSVGVGVASYPVIGTGQTAEFLDKDGEKEAAAGALTPNLLTGKRIQARVTFRLEDESTTAGLDAALREDLNLAIGDAMDAQIVGAGDARVRGFLATAANGGLADYANPGAVATFAAAAEQAARGVDGKYAGNESECTWIIGTASYQLLAGLIQSNDSTSATERLRRLLRDFMASANVPAAASNVQQGILAKLGAEGVNAVAPVWEGLRLIEDRVTAAVDGHINVTAVMLANFKILRPAGFVRTKLKLA